MKSKILSRPMFAGAIDPENVGIMHGFKDALKEDPKELMKDDEYEDDDALEREDDDEEGESGKMIGRTPRSPEILMNTLRGDMRSIPSRREELAELVGEKAAMNTPEEVLTLLQSSLGQGIGGIPSAQPSAGPAPGGATPPPLPPSGAGAPLQPPQGGNPLAGLAGLGQQLQSAGVPAAPPAMGASPPPPPPAPLNMASGGEVSYARYYAEGGEAQKKSKPLTTNSIAASPVSAQTELLDRLFAPPSAEEIGKTTKQFQGLFNEALGQNKEETERLRRSRMLAEVARSGFNFAANRGPDGAPLTGSFASRAAGAFGNLPVAYTDLLAKEAEARRITDVAALEQAIALHGKKRDLTASYLTSMSKTKAPKAYVEYSNDGKALGFYTIDMNGSLLDKNGEQVDPENLTGVLLEIGQAPPASTARDTGNAVTVYNIDSGENMRATEDVQTGEIRGLDGTTLGPKWVKITSVQTGPEGLSSTSLNKVNDNLARAGAATTNLLITADQGIKLLRENPESVTTFAPKVQGLLMQVNSELNAFGMKKDEDGNPLSVASFSSVKIPENLASRSDEFKNIVFQLALLELQASPLGKQVSNRDMQNALDLVAGSVVDSDTAARALERTKERALRNYALMMASADNRISGQSGRVISEQEVKQRIGDILSLHYGPDYAPPQDVNPSQNQGTSPDTYDDVTGMLNPDQLEKFNRLSPEQQGMFINRMRSRSGGNQ
jgi:hypothetical protein